jgi:hypothetical protein
MIDTAGVMTCDHCGDRVPETFAHPRDAARRALCLECFGSVEQCEACGTYQPGCTTGNGHPVSDIVTACETCRGVTA